VAICCDGSVLADGMGKP